jgi:hypothetical protein
MRDIARQIAGHGPVIWPIRAPSGQLPTGLLGPVAAMI